MPTAEPGLTATPSDEARSWLTAAAKPGQGSLRFAATCQTMETVFQIAQLAALAAIAQSVLDGGTQPTWPELAVLLAAGLMAAGAAWGAGWFRAAGRQRISSAIRQRVVAALLPARPPRAEVDTATVALAMVEFTDDIADRHAQAVPQRLSAPASMAIILVVTAVVQWPAAAIMLLASLLLPLNLRLAGAFAREGTDERVTATTRLGAVVLDSFRGMRTLQSIGAVRRRRTELADAAADLNVSTMRIVRRTFLSGAVMDVVITFSIASIATYVGLVLLGYIPAFAGASMSLASGLFALLLCPMYFQPLRAVAATYHAQERALSAVPTIMALLAQEEAVPSVAERSEQPRAQPVGVVLDEVTFRFPDSIEPVVKAVDILIDSGGWTAIVGPSGAGKTTLLSLIAGVRQPTSGTVRWVTPAGLSPPRFGGCAWIGQQTVILPGSIRDNIRIGRPAAGDEEIERAVASAGLADLMTRLPEGLKTQLGEGGSGLSTGEARRIAIARAFLLDADLWILDEPTAHLDAAAETRVIDALRDATEGRTVIVATHSLALARFAETVLRIDHGSVQAAQGAIAA
jgi:ATP-binding cassette, subfamily C, bacterial CydD